MFNFSLKRARELCLRHLHFVGPGLVSSVAYIDPGNFATDLQAGATYGYKLLFIVFISGLAAVVLQLLAVRLGAVTTTSLPTQIRLMFERLEKKRPRWKWGYRLVLWSLYAAAEIAIISTDLAELLGSAIALNLLFPRLPLWGGVLVTAADVLIVLIFFRSNSGRQGMLLFEIVIVFLVLAVFVCFAILLHLVKPDWREVFLGLVPSHTLIEGSALYVGVGIVGATVMPHALILGSALSGVDRLGMVPKPPGPAPGKGQEAMLGQSQGLRQDMRQGIKKVKDFKMPQLGRGILDRLKGKSGDHEEGVSVGAGAGDVGLELDRARRPSAPHTHTHTHTHAHAYGPMPHALHSDQLFEQVAELTGVMGRGDPVSDDQGEYAYEVEDDEDDRKVRDLAVHGHGPRHANARSSATNETDTGADEEYDDSLDLGTASEKRAWLTSVREYETSLLRFDRIRWVEIHLLHATIDTSYSLLGFALTINSAILTLAGAAYYFGTAGPSPDADLPGAFALISQYIGKGAGLLFALSLLCAGQSASITATLAGQVVSEGFIQWRTSPMIRRLVTRLIGVIPAAIVAAALGNTGLNQMLVASQVILSIILPTVIFPLVLLASKDEVMTVEGPEIEEGDGDEDGQEAPARTTIEHTNGAALTDGTERTAVLGGGSGGFGVDAPVLPVLTQRRTAAGTAGDTSEATVLPQPQHRARRSKSFRSPLWVTILGYLLFAIVIIANVYVIVELGLGVGT